MFAWCIRRSQPDANKNVPIQITSKCGELKAWFFLLLHFNLFLYNLLLVNTRKYILISFTYDSCFAVAVATLFQKWIVCRVGVKRDFKCVLSLYKLQSLSFLKS